MYLGARDTHTHFLLVFLGRASHEAREVSGPGSVLEAEEDVLSHSFAREGTAAVCCGRSTSSPKPGPLVSRPCRESTEPPSLALRKEQITALLCIHEMLNAVFN